MRNRIEFKMVLRIPMHKRKPIHQKTQQENNQCSFTNFPKYGCVGKRLPFLHGKAHCVSNDKHKGWKYEISRCKTIPACVQQRRIGRVAVSGSVYNDHKTNRHAAEHIEGKKSL